MKKYKLYKGNELVRNIAIAKGFVKKYNNKLDNSAILTLLGALGVEVYNNVYDNKFANFVIVCAEATILYGIFTMIYDRMREKTSEKKLERLKNVLSEKEIYITLLETFYFTIDEEENNIGMLTFSDQSFISYKNNDEIIYVDSLNDKKVDITDDVQKCMLSKRKYEKFKKDKQNK